MNKIYLKQIKKIAPIIAAVMCLSSCGDEIFEVYDDVYRYPFYNDAEDTVYVYDSGSHDNSDTITASQAVAQYTILKRIAPHGMMNLFVSGESLYRYGETGVSRIMVFRETTLESHTLKEIADGNIYDAFYIYPWTVMVTPGFEVRYDGESHWHYAHDSESHN